jgi:hypothetical protein
VSPCLAGDMNPHDAHATATATTQAASPAGRTRAVGELTTTTNSSTQSNPPLYETSEVRLRSYHSPVATPHS